ncbi:MFS transporter [Streptomyces sp. AcE210]|uniref:MFS transporter n=1 Tax=Streptomyces sp. AcE210 TaxID=2292703 RepID=UPI000E30586D|nr:MFS transporter [Streptomyces sp. AcE210]RFC77524.1 DHA2 family efflux MFS transporter permease subunit [Streptomyces sp. AcE210]
MSLPPVTTDPRRWLALVFISVAQLMVVLDATIVNIALPSAQADLGISEANRPWVITAYALAFGGLLLVGGRITDLWGRKRAFITGLLGFAAASALGGAATGQGMLFSARALQGGFAALMAPAAMSLLTVTFTEARERAKAFGIFAAIAGGGGGLGLILGGVLTEYLNWRWTFFVIVPFSVLATLGALATVHEPREARNHTRLDVPGAVLATLGLVSLVYGFSRAETDGWTTPATFGMFIAALVLLAAFVLVQARTRSPLLPLRIVTERNRGGAYLVVGLAGVGMFAVFLFLTYFLQTVQGYSALRTGFAILPMVLGMLIGSTQISARLLHQLPPRVLIVPGLLVATTGMVLLALLHPDSSYGGHILPALLLIGLGMGTTLMAAITLGNHGVRPTDAGIASATVNAAQQIGGAIGTALLNTVVASATAGYLAGQTGSGRASAAEQLTATTHGYTTAFWWASGLLLLAAVLATALITAGRPGATQVRGASQAAGSQAVEEPEAPLLVH